MSERVEYVEVPVRVAKPILDFLGFFKIDAKEYLEYSVAKSFVVNFQSFGSGRGEAFITETFIDYLIEKFHLKEILENHY